MRSTPSCTPDLLKLLVTRRMPLVMGIVNVTPDSFYAASRAGTTAEAVGTACRMVQEGADVLDIGGQSTRPGSRPVALEQELERVLPVIEALASRVNVPISVDTDKAEVAGLALEAGASIVNDVSALRNDPGMMAQAVKADAVILMHRGGGSPKDMQEKPVYADVVAEVKGFLQERKDAFLRAGGAPAGLLLDVGIGFGKTVEHNLSLIKHIEEFNCIAPQILGVSRKSFLGSILAGGGEMPPPELRLEGSLAVACWAFQKGVKMLRVHDVGATVRALKTMEAVAGAR